MNTDRYAVEKEHALLAEIVRLAHEKRLKDGKSGGIGRTALQKIVYFLKVLEVPMRYRFDIYTYGPFCASILTDTEWLEADEAIVDLSENQGKASSYSPGERVDELLELHRDFLNEHKKLVENVVKGLATAPPSTLELISTTDFAYRWLTTELGRPPDETEVVEKVSSLKKGKFTVSQRKKAYAWLMRAVISSN